VRACLRCTTAFTYPPPASDRQYDEHSFFTICAGNEPRWRRAAEDLTHFIASSGCSNGALLDVGFGSGLFIEAALAAGFRAEGIEASHPAVASARERGIQAKEGYLAPGSYPEASFDVVVMNHVLEHVADPLALLVIVRKLLKPNGCLCLGQTNYLGTVPRLLGARWYGWAPTEHYSHFTLLGIAFLLRRAGFRVKSSRITTLFWDWVGISGFPIAKWPGVMLSNLAALVTQWRLGFPFVGDQFNVLAQPED
jgi:SAM-dependent methyltransferase